MSRRDAAEGEGRDAETLQACLISARPADVLPKNVYSSRRQSKEREAHGDHLSYVTTEAAMRTDRESHISALITIRHGRGDEWPALFNQGERCSDFQNE